MNKLIPLMCIRCRLFLGRVRRFLKGLPPFEDCRYNIFIMWQVQAKFIYSQAAPFARLIAPAKQANGRKARRAHRHVKNLLPVCGTTAEKFNGPHMCVRRTASDLSRRLSFASLASCSPPTPTLALCVYLPRR